MLQPAPIASARRRPRRSALAFAAAISESAGTPITFETAGVLFFATIIDATTNDSLLITVHEATDPRFAARLPKRLWLTNVTSRLRDRTLRIGGPTRQPDLLTGRLAA